ncbi:MAG: hypothetical protein DUD39_04880 [Coriobacteriaceae bacterium]|nr:MAG: hypothetical protein DUD39_04880 [Coriobacteriaceae bacterium]
MCMRLFEVMQAALGAFRYGPTVSCQKIGIYIDESLAGNRDKVGHPDAEKGAHARPCCALLWHIEQEGLRGGLRK